jgi:hypothetical protein
MLTTITKGSFLVLLATLLAITACSDKKNEIKTVKAETPPPTDSLQTPVPASMPVAAEIIPVSVTLTSGPNPGTPPGWLFDHNTLTSWSGGTNAAVYPIKCVVDFGAYYDIAQLIMFDGQGSSNANLMVDVLDAPGVPRWPTTGGICYGLPSDYSNLWRQLTGNTPRVRYVGVQITAPTNMTMAGNMFPELQFHGTPSNVQ